ncbi:hypothetical protein HNY73_012151 [Argiope bruennichi]|uniref:Uncharacterized protein n=1 Tax=Argiope bruennichi TaxID=94029 RepID=A0A8T0EYT0_ARGBR|nr:hypothetical protein HNY73_012151 [Argiope bruennichi]
MRKAIYNATAFYSKFPPKDGVQKLQKCMINVTYHVFGRHEQCIEAFCKEGKKTERDMVEDLQNSGLLFIVMTAIQNLAAHSKSLLFAADNNCVEQFNAIVAKFIGGKRINFCLRNSYQARCNGAVISHNSRSLMSSVHKNMYNTSPGICVKSLERKRQKERQQRKGKLHQCRKTLFRDKARNKSYGPSAEKPDLLEQEFRQKREQMIKSLQLSDAEAASLERATIEQKGSSLWREERRKRLTASDFGIICCRKESTSCENIIKNKLKFPFSFGRL